MDMEVAGMALEGDDDIEFPVAAVMCVKGLDANGVVSYYLKATGGLPAVEALGMAGYLYGGMKKTLNL